MLQIQPLQKGLINKCVLTNTNAHMHILTRYLKKNLLHYRLKNSEKVPIFKLLCLEYRFIILSVAALPQQLVKVYCP